MKLLVTAVGDPLGGCRITPYGYSVMLKKVVFQFNLISYSASSGVVSPVQ